MAEGPARARAAGIAASTEALWAALHDSIHAFVSRRVRRPADVDDVVQRVFLQVHRALPALRDADRVHAWMYQTARRAIADYYRAPALRRELVTGDAIERATAIPAPPGPDAGAWSDAQDPDAAEREMAGCLAPLMARLAEADRQALQLVEVDGVSQVEAASRLGLSVSGMKSRVQRARARLRSSVEACCRVDLDRRGRPLSFEHRGGAGAAGGCGSCG